MTNATVPLVSLPDGFKVPALGQGTWNMGDVAKHAAAEAEVLRQGIELPRCMAMARRNAW
jgi:diketogulonate reductase-like aldo/keto reductase